MFRKFLSSLRKQSSVTKGPPSIANIMEVFGYEPFASFSPFSVLKDQGYPALDISESDFEIVVTAELPGLEPKEVEITVNDDTLFIKGEKKFEEKNYHSIERSYGRFRRSVILPCSVKDEKIRTSFDKGVLTVTMVKPKKERGMEG